MSTMNIILLIAGIYLTITSSLVNANGGYLFKIFVKGIPVLLGFYVIMYAITKMNIL